MILASVLLALTADLEVFSVTPAKTEVFTDETFAFSVGVRNNGPETAGNVKVNVGTNASSLLQTIVAPPAWTCDAQGPRFGYGFVCTTPSLKPGSEAELKVTLGAPQPSAMTYRVGASVSSNSADPVQTNNRREANLALLVSKTNAELLMTARPAESAEKVTFDVRNEGPDDAREVLAVVEGASKVSGKGWKCVPARTGVVCTRPALKAGTVAPLDARGADAAKISARVRAEQNHDSKPLDNAASAVPRRQAQLP